MALQRLQLLAGSLTKTSLLPRHTGQAPLVIGFPAQNPQVFGRYADILELVMETFREGSYSVLLTRPERNAAIPPVLEMVRGSIPAGPTGSQ